MKINANCIVVSSFGMGLSCFRLEISWMETMGIYTTRNEGVLSYLNYAKLMIFSSNRL